MSFFSNSSYYQPIGSIGRLPIYVTTIIAALYVAGMLATTMLLTAGGPMGYFIFSADAFYHRGWLWQLFTCPFVNGADFFFLFGVFFFYTSSIEVERYLGRSRYLQLYFLTLLMPALILGLWMLLGYSGEFAGMMPGMIALFIAFTTLYPNIEFLGWVPLKYVAFACVAISCLNYFPRHDWPGLSVLVAQCALGFGFVRCLQLGWSLNPFSHLIRLNPFRRRPKFRVLPSPSAPPPRSAKETTMQTVDAILDKIAQSGFASLTPAERDRLDQARDTLLKNQPPPD